jgi:hypothetical protein
MDAAAGRTAPSNRHPTSQRPKPGGRNTSPGGIDDPMARCPSRVPHHHRPLPFQIVQMPDSHPALRSPPRLSHRSPMAARIPTMRSRRRDSVAHQMATRCVDVTSFNDRPCLPASAPFTAKTARHRALHSRLVRHHPLRRHPGGSRGLHQAVAPARDVQASSQRAASRIRMHREQRRPRSLREAASDRSRAAKTLVEPYGDRRSSETGRLGASASPDERHPPQVFPIPNP